MEGQLTDQERQFLYDVVCKEKPKVALEIGTWKGGGSTFFISEALKTYSGVLYTCEIDVGNFRQAVELYRDNPIVKLNLCRGVDLIEKLIGSNTIPDLAFFDGSEIADENLRDFKMLEPHLKIGAAFLAHDWELGLRIDGAFSTKNTTLRPYIESSPNWQIIDTISAPYSVGLVYAKKIA